jgi:hypothetical protein
MEYPCTHGNGTPDKRYSISEEYLGYSVPMFAARFCGELIGACRTRDKAAFVIATHNSDRLDKLSI